MTKETSQDKVQRCISKLWDNFEWPTTHVKGVPKHKRGKGGEEKTVIKTVPNLMKPLNPQIQKLTNPKHKNMKQCTPRHITIKLLKARGNGKILKSGEKKRHVHIQEWNKDSRFLRRNKTSKKTVECYNISKILEEKTSNLEYYIHQNYLLKVKTYKKSFQT